MIGASLSRRADDLRAARTPFVVATVVRAQRPTSVRSGDAAIVLGDGTIEGFVGGACAEQSVRLHALRALETGEALLLRILPGDDDAPAAEGAVTVQNPCLSGGSLEIFLEPMLTSPRVLVVGETPIAAAVARLGAELDLDMVTVPGTEVEPLADDLALVVAAHGRDELRALRRALEAGVPYVGLVASRVRGAAVVAELRAEGVADEQPGGAGDAGRARHRRAHPRGDRALDPRADRRRAPWRADGVGARGGTHGGARDGDRSGLRHGRGRGRADAARRPRGPARVLLLRGVPHRVRARPAPVPHAHIDTVRWFWTRSQSQ